VPEGRPTWYDVVLRRWRQLDLAGTKLWLEADIARIDCPACERVRTREVPWARPGVRGSRDVEDTIARLATRMDKSAIAILMRCAWRTVNTERLEGPCNCTGLSFCPTSEHRDESGRGRRRGRTAFLKTVMNAQDRPSSLRTCHMSH